MSKLNIRNHRLKLIFILGIVVYFIFMVLLYKAENGSPNSNIHTLGDAVWYSIVTLSTVGYGDYYPVSTTGRIFGSFLVIGSLGMVGYVYGNVSNSIRNFVEKRKLGMYGTSFTDHIIIFGYDSFANQVIDQIVESNHAVAVVSNKKSDIDLILEHYGDNPLVFALFMDYTHLEGLEKVNIKHARTVFVNFEDDTETLVYFLNIKGYCPESEIVVSIYNTSLKTTFLNAGVTHLVCKTDLSSKLIASFMFEPDVAQLTEDIMATATSDDDYDMIEILVKKDNFLIKKDCKQAFFEIRERFDAVLLGISKKIDNEWTLIKNPGVELIVEPTDYLIIMVNGSSKKSIQEHFGVKEGKQSNYSLKK